MKCDERLEKIIAKAKSCPRIFDGEIDPRVVELSELLKESGYGFLAKAVLGGCRWASDIADGSVWKKSREGGHELKEAGVYSREMLAALDGDAGNPLYSWNQVEERPLSDKELEVFGDVDKEPLRDGLRVRSVSGLEGVVERVGGKITDWHGNSEFPRDVVRVVGRVEWPEVEVVEYDGPGIYEDLKGAVWFVCEQGGVLREENGSSGQESGIGKVYRKKLRSYGWADYEAEQDRELDGKEERNDE